MAGVFLSRLAESADEAWKIIDLGTKRTISVGLKGGHTDRLPAS